MRIQPTAVGLILVLAGLIGLAVPLSTPSVEPAAKPSQAPPTAARTACRVLTVYDGDTLGCDLNGNGRVDPPREKVRLLGVDSPEMRYSRKNPTYQSAHPQDQPFAAAASRWLSDRTLKKTVYLEFDQRRTDRYGRTLAHIYTGPNETVSLNGQLLEAGYATVLFIGQNRLYETEYRQQEARARKRGLGLWQGP